MRHKAMITQELGYSAETLKLISGRHYQQLSISVWRVRRYIKRCDEIMVATS